jgi:D-alanyl-D-alanine dipeptidase
VVTTKNWSASSGTLQRYISKNRKWQKIGKQISIKVGRNGLAWGIGEHTIPKNAQYIKHEGDGKAPAGIFKLKNGFGYSKFNIKYPYKVYSRYNHCVDDSNSKYYNQIVDSRKVKKDYKSFEYMKFNKDYYQYGVVVAHNEKAQKGRGSCIFLHIKSVPTAGCTVMSKNEIKEILRWLDKSKNPLLIQAPKSEIKALLPF